MRHHLWVALVLAACAHDGLIHPAAAVEPVAKKFKPADPFEIAERLQKRPKDSTFLPAIKLHLFIEIFQDAVGVPVQVDLRSFTERQEAEDTLRDLELSVRDHRFSLEHILADVCEQAKFGYLIEKDRIRLVSAEAAQLLQGETREIPNLYRNTPKRLTLAPRENMPPPNAHQQLYKLLPTITCKLDEVPLKEVLEKFQQRSGRTILLAGDAKESGDAKISASFLNVPVEAALQTIGELSGLQAAKNGNVVLFVTPARFNELHEMPPAMIPPAEEPKPEPTRQELLDEIERLKKELAGKKP
ncbi:hypothetical protein [Zavarzinella formosa]|uniref:hypothetical protein n=1 Tax=Zavarzinella formosa TaxID=360055 RepID=UPI0002F6144C|nr:hypothetical protein [Zavarzinella formosa]